MGNTESTYSETESIGSIVSKAITLIMGKTDFVPPSHRALKAVTGMQVMSADMALATGHTGYHINSPIMHAKLFPYYYNPNLENDEDFFPTKEPTEKNKIKVQLQHGSGKIEDFFVHNDVSIAKFNSFLKKENILKTNSKAYYEIDSLKLKDSYRPFSHFLPDGTGGEETNTGNLSSQSQNIVPGASFLVKVEAGTDVKTSQWQEVAENEAVTTTDSLDSRWDYDFTNLKEQPGENYSRGNEPYYRPYGWNRYALDVLGKFKDGDTWLGESGHREESSPREWIVTYHGTSSKAATNIIDEDFYRGADNIVHGEGHYTTNIPEEAEWYAKRARKRDNPNADYIYIIQNRLNPQSIKMKRTKRVDKGKSEYGKPLYYFVTENTEAAKNDIRMYGILEKKYQA